MKHTNNYKQQQQENKVSKNVTMSLYPRGMEQTMPYILTRPRNLMVVTRAPVQMRLCPGANSVQRQNM